MTAYRRKPRDYRPHRALGERIAELRHSLQLNQDELAQRVGLSRGYIPLIERGRARPSVETLNQIARALYADPQELKQLAGFAERPRGEVVVMTDPTREPFLRRFNLLSTEALQKLAAIAQVIAFGQDGDEATAAQPSATPVPREESRASGC